MIRRSTLVVKFSKIRPSALPQSYSYTTSQPGFDHLPSESWSFRGGRNSVSGVVATVYGSTGFLGPYVVNRLGSTGSRVILPFRGEENDLQKVKYLGEPGQILPIRFSIRDQDSIEAAAAPANVVINLVGRWWDTRNFTSEEANVKSAISIAEAGKHAQRFIYVSAVGADQRSRSKFYREKALAEEAVRSIVPNATIIRTTRMFGDEDNLLNKYGLISRYWPFYPAFHESVPMQPVFVGDVANAIHQSLLHPATQGQTYEVGGPQTLTLGQFQEFLYTLIKTTPVRLPVPAALMEYLATWNEKLRKPTFSHDEIVRFGIPNVVSGDYPDLFPIVGVKPRTLEEMAIHSVRQYRRPAVQSELY